MDILKKYLSSNVKKFYLIVIFCILLFCNSIHSQSILMDSVKNICSSISTINIPVRVKNFKKILGFQGSITWDTTVFKYNSIVYGSSIIVLNSGSINLDKVTLGLITYVWTDPNNVAETVLDSTLLFTLQFKLIKSISGSKNISFNSSPTSLGVAMIDSNGGYSISNKTNYQNGNIGFISSPSILRSHDTLSSVVNGTPSFYQWNLNGAPIIGANSSVYNAAKVVGGSYSLTVKYNNGCSVTSATVLPIKKPIFSVCFEPFTETPIAHLDWYNDDNINNCSYYLIERSTNGIEFYPIKKTFSTLNNESYHFTLKDTLIENVQKYYYRLLSFNIDGTFSVSNSESISFITRNKLKVIPNPAKDVITLQFTNSKQELAIITIKEISGNTILDQKARLVNGKNTITINISTLRPGNYFLTINNGETCSNQFIKL